MTFSAKKRKWAMDEAKLGLNALAQRIFFLDDYKKMNGDVRYNAAGDTMFHFERERLCASVILEIQEFYASAEGVGSLRVTGRSWIDADYALTSHPDHRAGMIELIEFLGVVQRTILEYGDKHRYEFPIEKSI